MNDFLLRTTTASCWWVCIGVCALAALVGCATPRSTSPASGMPIGNNRASDLRAANKEIEQARRMITAGDYNVVIPRLIHVISKYPDSSASLEARYWLGVTYHQIRGYRDAIEQFEEYLRIAPEGPRAEEAQRLIAMLSDEYEERFLTAEKIEDRLRQVEQDLQADPQNLDIQLQKADQLWSRGDYDDAGRMYFKITQDHPQYARDETISRRIEIHSDDQYTVLSPKEIQQREIDEQPLIIVNTSYFRSGRDRYTREPTHYVVTGQALNRSDSTLQGVRVHVTLYGFGGMVFDARTVNIGRLNPGERRAFSVQFSHFENIENISRFECEGTFQ